MLGYGFFFLQMSSCSSRHRDALRVWIREQAQRLDREHFGLELQGLTHPALSVLNRLIAAIQELHSSPAQCISALTEIMHIVTSSDISSFELIHSGLVNTLLLYLTATDRKEDIHSNKSSDKNSVCESTSKVEELALSKKSSSGASPINSGLSGSISAVDPEVYANITQCPRDERLRNFLHVFLGCSTDSLVPGGACDPNSVSRFTGLLSKLMSCVNQLEQFPVKVHDLPGGGAGGSRGGASSAIKFLNTHQLKCNLQRDPSCTRLREWRGGPVKVDPLALVQAIERYVFVTFLSGNRKNMYN